MTTITPPEKQTPQTPERVERSQSWHRLTVKEAVQQLGVHETAGLNAREAAERLAAHGPNELAERGLKSPWRILREQFTATLMVILIVAAVISAALGDYKDASVILSVVFLNALLGFFQEYRAEKAIAALKKMAVPSVKVRRDSQVREISARELVPGDVVLLEAGNLVPADGRLLSSSNLRIQEAALTGESEPVEKNAHTTTPEDAPLGDRRGMAYMGTAVSYGRGEAVVTATGMRTELGAIAAMIQTVERQPTPLQKRLDQLGRRLAWIALAIVAVIFALGVLRGEDLKTMFLTAVSLAVAAVPEGLPAVVTIALALGAQRMLKRRALIRKLAAVETLGSVTVICSDKTGTLTENRMSVTVLDVAGQRIDMADILARSSPDPQLGAEGSTGALALTLTGGALCNDALLESASGKLADLRVIGDPTEAALVRAAAQLGYKKAELEARFPRIAEVPFDSERKRMTTVHQDLETKLGSPYVAFTKGAVDGILTVSARVLVGQTIEPLTESWRQRINAANENLAQNGMRVLGVAYRPLASLPPETTAPRLEQELVFVGLQGMIDPPRTEVRAAVRTCQAAGIRPIMITGDHPLTALAIARQLGIAQDARVLTGQELDRLSVQELERLVEKVPVYARVSPEHKLKIVQALQNRGQVAAMTGDGVNDAPALKKADIGVAMGITGTDVSKEAADMVLLDDNFATIVAAVEEGRVIYDNIRKFIKYLMTTNSAEILIMLLGPFIGMPLPLLPLQILWINLVTDGPPALALGVEPAERGIMRRLPIPPAESILARGTGRHILWVGILMALISLAVGYGYWDVGSTRWQTMLFTTLAFSQMCHVLAIRSDYDSLFRIGLFSNKLLAGAVGLTVLSQMAVVYMPLLQSFFKTVPLTGPDLLICIFSSSLIFWGVELEKWFKRKNATNEQRKRPVTGQGIRPKKGI
ncbi:MAG TPA: ATPase [Elusimicrobia bacterium]|nr:ATPase [Elusimicrobiota bacterium]HBT62549.1 ATPase [Elusimicrobiota bacterium]